MPSPAKSAPAGPAMAMHGLAGRPARSLAMAPAIGLTARLRAARRSRRRLGIFVLGVAGVAGVVAIGAALHLPGAVLGPVATGAAWALLGQRLAGAARGKAA